MRILGNWVRSSTTYKHRANAWRLCLIAVSDNHYSDRRLLLDANICPWCVPVSTASTKSLIKCSKSLFDTLRCIDLCPTAEYNFYPMLSLCLMLYFRIQYFGTLERMTALNCSINTFLPNAERSAIDRKTIARVTQSKCETQSELYSAVGHGIHKRFHEYHDVFF